MLHSAEGDPKVEFVANQLKRVGWISDYKFITGRGYRLEWLPVGGQRMTLLRIALWKSRGLIHGLDRLNTSDPVTDNAIRDFWTACTSQLDIRGDDQALPIFVNIVENWEPQQVL